MKWILWILGVLPLAVTAALLPLMPDSVPMHYGLSGEVDRWGSKYELLALSLVFIAVPLVIQVCGIIFRKKAASVSEEKERIYAGNNERLLSVIGIATALLMDVVYGVILYAIYTADSEHTGSMFPGMEKIVCLVLGVYFVVIGNFMPKTKKNSLIGIRTTWSMYNDDTWRKSNRFSGYLSIVCGLLIIVEACLLSGAAVFGTMIALIVAAVAVMTLQSYYVYRNERKKERK